MSARRRLFHAAMTVLCASTGGASVMAGKWILVVPMALIALDHVALLVVDGGSK